MTDQPKWTPGPWALNIRASMGDATGEIVAEIEPTNSARDYRGDITRLQSCCHIGGIGHEELTANANLIAAAPDLYAALDAAMAFIESHVADPDITDVMIRNYRTLQDLRPRDVLAKARGETK